MNPDETLCHLPEYNWVAKLNKDESDFEEFALQLNPEMLEFEEQKLSAHDALYATNQFYKV